MRGVVLKSHHYLTTPLCSSLNELGLGVELFGSLVLNWAVGLETLPEPAPPAEPITASETMAQAQRLTSELTAQRWRQPTTVDE